MAEKAPVKVRLYRFRNVLRDKVGAGAGGVAMKIDPAAIEKATAALTAMAEDYPDWVAKHIDELRVHHVRCVDTPGERLRHYAGMREIAQGVMDHDQPQLLGREAELAQGHILVIA